MHLVQYQQENRVNTTKNWIVLQRETRWWLVSDRKYLRGIFFVLLPPVCTTLVQTVLCGSQLVETHFCKGTLSFSCICFFWWVLTYFSFRTIIVCVNSYLIQFRLFDNLLCWFSIRLRSSEMALYPMTSMLQDP